MKVFKLQLSIATSTGLKETGFARQVKKLFFLDEIDTWSTSYSILQKQTDRRKVYTLI